MTLTFFRRISAAFGAPSFGESAFGQEGVDISTAAQTGVARIVGGVDINTRAGLARIQSDSAGFRVDEPQPKLKGIFSNL